MLNSGFYNMDCMDGMKQFPDKFFDLAIVDPPYGNAINPSANNLRGGQPTGNSAEDSAGGSPTTICRTGGSWSKKYQKGGIFECDIRIWDIAPDAAYFDELGRVSKNQIIWGGNYFNLPPTRCFLVWQKLTISEKFSMAMCEYAWTSFNDNAKLFACAPQGTAKEKRFHPTQKPIALYTWILNLYAKEGYKILDTHVGSASSLIACYRAGLEYWGFETHKGYWQKATERLETEKAQMRMTF
jgi:site-specific DNA-methyltransferase (adenine-specific)